MKVNKCQTNVNYNGRQLWRLTITTADNTTNVTLQIAQELYSDGEQQRDRHRAIAHSTTDHPKVL